MASAFAFCVSAQAQEPPPLIDGTIWTESSEVEKESYLVGASDFLMVELIVQSKADTPLTDDQSAISEWHDALEHVIYEDLIEAIDAWYAANPGSIDTPVLVVVWNEYVETD